MVAPLIGLPVNSLTYVAVYVFTVPFAASPVVEEATVRIGFTPQYTFPVSRKEAFPVG